MGYNSTSICLYNNTWWYQDTFEMYCSTTHAITIVSDVLRQAISNNLDSYNNDVWTISRNIQTHCGRVTHICVSKLTIIGSDNGDRLVAWSVPSHYLNHCWNNINSNAWNKLQWNLMRNPCRDRFCTMNWWAHNWNLLENYCFLKWSKQIPLISCLHIPNIYDCLDSAKHEISVWKSMGVYCWPLKIGPKKIEAKREFWGQKDDSFSTPKIVLVLVNYMRHTLWC